MLWQVFQQLLLIGKLDAVTIATSLFANWFWHILSSTSLARHKAIQMRHVKISVKMMSLCCVSALTCYVYGPGHKPGSSWA